MAKADDDLNLDDEKITLSENEGVDEEDLKAPEDEPAFRRSAEPKEVQEEEVAVAEDEPKRELHQPVREPEESVEELPRSTYPARNEEPLQEQPVARPEHTLNDLADEEPDMAVPIGVDPNSRPKSFRMAYDEDEPDQYASNIPHIGSQLPSSGVYANREPKKRGGGFKLVLLLIVAILVLGGAVYLLKGKSLFKSGGSTPNPTPATVVESSPTPVPTPSFDRTKFTVDVLNGSGKTGLAASVSAKLTGLGYKIGKTGNATNSAFQTTQVLVKNGDDDLLQNLITDLAPDYTASSGGFLKDSSTSDGEVIIGAK
jgi:hypothetical protein